MTDFNGIQTQHAKVILSTADCVRVENGTRVSPHVGKVEQAGNEPQCVIAYTM
ncbi:MAG: hypothetical protein ABIT36_01780 [Steroidobacteraceae bacterium]